MDFLTDQSTKFPFDPKKPKNGFLQVRICTDEGQRDISKKVRSVKISLEPIFKHGPLQEIRSVSVDEDLESEEIWDFCIVGWGGVILDGEKLECTRENKVKMMAKCPDFASFYTKCLIDLNKMYKEKFSGTSELGNLSRSQPSRKKSRVAKDAT